ncbi:MAG: flagellar hook-basal body complex protein FliE [Rhodospirillaceae bacterium]|jgi:flagellar hook-basal body complex protein FliE|nr:flagellar hook-basal body complex protein FliE [Rhodospirillaceae bacterium]MBT5566104.1 flagellar hook-basal body complex protein FliE [Rhodospirillaceae bacterium]
MAMDFNTAISAYREAAGAIREAGNTGNAAALGNPDGSSFVNMVTDSLQNAVETGKQAEQVSMANIAGQASTMDVVTAVANAQHSLETVVAVRDKVMQAYQEILRMPI